MKPTIQELLGVPEDTPNEEMLKKIAELKAAYDQMRVENPKDTQKWITYQNKIMALDDAFLEHQRRQIAEKEKKLFRR